jgi:poly(3-hydroxybutyrate) depolymerase
MPKEVSLVKKQFAVVLSVFVVLVSVLMVSGSYAASVRTPAMTQTQVKVFPDIKYMELVKDLDPKNAYGPMFKGMYEDRVDVKGKKRTFKTYIPESVTQGDNSIYIAVPSGTDTVTFLEKSGWKEIADKYRLYLFAFEPENRKWNAAAAADEIEYIRAVFNRIINVRPYYNILMGNYYFVGYGTGGTLLQQFIMTNPKNCAGLVVFDGSDITEQYMKETGAKISDDPRVPLSKVKAPVWIIAQSLKGNTQKVINYWKNANDCTDTVYTTPYATVYPQTLVRAGRLDNDQNVSKVLVSVKKINYTDARFNEVVWKDFLGKTCRYGTNVYNNALRPYTSFEDLGIKKVEMNVDGFARHWFEYVPSIAKTNPDKKLPLLVVMHGSGQTGAIMVPYTEWYKVAEERGLIAVFPTGYPVAFPNATPRPGWNLGTDINPVDDVKFINEMVKNIKSKYSIDSTRVYLTGQSFGGFMSHHMAMMSPEVFAAVGSTSGPILAAFKDKTIGISNPAYKFPAGVNTKYEMPVWMVMGEFDLFGGGSFKKDPDAKETMAYWIARNNAGDIEKPATYKSGIFNHQVWTNAAGVPMARYSITAGRQHNFAVTETWMLWDEFLCKFSRKADGKIEYMQDQDVMK